MGTILCGVAGRDGKHLAWYVYGVRMADRAGLIEPAAAPGTSRSVFSNVLKIPSSATSVYDCPQRGFCTVLYHCVEHGPEG